MFFNTIDFAIFLPIVFVLYWFVTNKNLKLQNILIVVASYVFYGWWDWRFLLLILFSTIIDYTVGLKLSKEEDDRKRKYWLWLSLFVNLGLLGFFKYYNFFIENYINAFTFLGLKPTLHTLKIILPVGISFYTFQTMSYTIDVYRRKLKPTSDFIVFAAFVSFFPQLVAGPIERATHLLPQFYKSREFDYQKSIDGLRQILWGLFKKVVIADNCADFANHIFNNSTDYTGGTLVLGAFFFAFQIYGDFSGYSDIAIGTSRLFGFDLMKNFAFPYFSRDIGEFWRRWHISLSTWFRDYLYIPLGGSRGSMGMKIRNVFVIFLVSGFWHGSKWTFIIWGGLNALYFIPLLLAKKNRNHIEIVAIDRSLPTLKEFSQIIFTFGITIFAWIFFRAKDLPHAWQYIRNMFKPSIPKGSDFIGTHIHPIAIFIFVFIFVLIEWIGRREEYAIADLGLRWYKPLRWGFYLLIAITTLLFSGSQQEFIYFRF